MSKRKGPTPRVERWAPFEMDPRSGTDAVRGALVFGNGWWTVHVDVIDEETKWDGWLWLAIHDRPRSTRHDWRELQRVKNAIVGVERDALELYPAEDRLVDTSNEYHLFVMPTGERFPFGFSERTVTDEATPTEIVGAMRQAAEATGSSFNIAQAVKVRQRRRGPG